jgi:hypothetical protein
MTKLVLILLSSCFGVIGFSTLQRTAARSRGATTTTQLESDSVTNEFAEMHQKISTARAEVIDKKNRLLQAAPHGDITPKLLRLLEGDAGSSVAWTELRQQLGIGWDSSPDYVLVNKRVLKRLDYERLDSNVRASDTACNLLALSPDEQSALRTILDRAREGEWLRVERAEPAGDVVAQYTARAPDPKFEQGQSNLFVTQVTALLGPERAGLLMPGAWREFKYELAPREAETLTIRRTSADGVPDLIWEMQYGGQVATSPIRYANYPSRWFLKVFPGGWQTLADREVFELPEKFRQRQN